MATRTLRRGRSRSIVEASLVVRGYRRVEDLLLVIRPFGVLGMPHEPNIPERGGNPRLRLKKASILEKIN
jgi:hypothetical protein